MNLIPKSFKRKINYIKKNKIKSDEDLEEAKEIADIMELSEREIRELIDLESHLNK
jgi:hypothetical protein